MPCAANACGAQQIACIFDRRLRYEAAPQPRRLGHEAEEAEHCGAFAGDFAAVREAEPHREERIKARCARLAFAEILVAAFLCWQVTADSLQDFDRHSSLLWPNGE